MPGHFIQHRSTSCFLSLFGLFASRRKLWQSAHVGLLHTCAELEAAPPIAEAHSSIIGGAFRRAAAGLAAASCGGSDGAGLDILGAMAASRTPGPLGQPKGQWFSATNSGCNSSTSLQESPQTGSKQLCAMPQLVSATTSQKRLPISGLLLIFVGSVIPFNFFVVFIPNHPKTVFSRFIFPWRFHTFAG